MYKLNDQSVFPNSPGIYSITCGETGKFYIGSSVNIRERIGQHIYRLKKNTHSNPILQAIWNDDPLRLVFDCVEMIESKEKSVILQAEQRHLDKAGVGSNRMCMNVLITANSHLGLKRSEETKRKLREANLGKKLSPEHIEKLRLAKIGKKQSPEHIRKRTGNQKGRKINRPKGIIRASQRALSADQVRELRRLRESGLSWCKLAEAFNMSSGAVKRAATRVTYQDIE
jgi:group I intron endonuclease